MRAIVDEPTEVPRFPNLTRRTERGEREELGDAIGGSGRVWLTEGSIVWSGEVCTVLGVFKPLIDAKARGF